MQVGSFLTVVTTVLLAGSVLAADPAPGVPFYAEACFYGDPDPRYAAPAEQMRLLADLGYDGYSQFGVDGYQEILKAVKDNHLRLFHLYDFVSVDPAATPRYSPQLPDAIRALRGSDTMIGLILRDKPPTATEYDEHAVAVVREIADMAADAGLRVALYPHENLFIERVQDAVRIAKKTERTNVGVVFNEVHFFLVDHVENLEAAIRDAAPYLDVVNINGTDSPSPDRSLAHLLQPLDRGSFDNLALLKLLRAHGYSGPIGLHCYQFPGDIRENLARSIAAWKTLSTRLNETSAK